MRHLLCFSVPVLPAAVAALPADTLIHPETTFFNWPEKLPEDIAAELQDLMLVRKPWEKRSQRFDWYANTKSRHNSRWNFRADGNWEHGYYVFKPKGTGAVGHTSHILGVASRVANLAWQRYQFTRDEAWLRDRAYPLIKGAAEFYRNFPNLQKGDDGLYRINHTNSGESAWNSRDAPYERPICPTSEPATPISWLLRITPPTRPRASAPARSICARRRDAAGSRRRFAHSRGDPRSGRSLRGRPSLRRCRPEPDRAW